MHFLSLLFVLFFSMPVFAQDQYAQKLEEAVTTQIELIETTLKTQFPEGVLKIDGKTQIEDAGEYYAITSPHISYMFADYKVDFGVVAINAALLEEKPEKWSLSVALPSSILVYQKENIIGRLEFGSQVISMHFVPSLNYYTFFDLGLKNTTYKDFIGKYGFEIKEIKIGREATQQKENLWNVKETSKIADIKVTDETQDKIFSLEEFIADTITTNINLNQIVEAIDNVQAVSEWTTDNPQEAQLESFLRSSIGLFEKIFNSFEKSDSVITMNDMYLKDKQKGQEVIFSNIDMTSSIDNKEDGFVSARIKIKLEDAKPIEGSTTSKLSTLPPGTFPIEFAIGYNVKTFPEAEPLLAIIEKLITSGVKASTPEEQKKVQEQGLTELVALLQKTGTILGITDTYVSTAAVRVDTNGTFTFKENVAKNGVADFKIWIDGLDKLGQNQAIATSPAAGFLPMVGALGQPVADKPGVRQYHIQLMEDGRVLLNGQDMSAMLGGLGQRQ